MMLSTLLQCCIVIVRQIKLTVVVVVCMYVCMYVYIYIYICRVPFVLAHILCDYVEKNDLCSGLVTQHGCVNPQVNKVQKMMPREK